MSPSTCRTSIWVLAVAGMAVVSLAHSQTLEGKVPAKGKIMSFSELKACIVEQESLKSRRLKLESQRAQLDTERSAIDQEAASIERDRETLSQRNAEIKAHNEAATKFSARVAELNARQDELNQDSRSTPSLERRRRELAKDQDALKEEITASQSKGEGLVTAITEFVNKLNARIVDHQKLANDWNARSRAVNENGLSYEDDHSDWKSRCGERRYREDDEKLIRADLAKGK